MQSFPNSVRMSSSSQSSSLEPVRQFRTVDELVDATTQAWMQEFEQKKAKWEKMTHEQRVAYIKATFARLKQEFARDPQAGLMKFMQWLISPEGSLAWPYIWKEPYRPYVIRITAKAYRLANKYLPKTPPR